MTIANGLVATAGWRLAVLVWALGLAGCATRAAVPEPVDTEQLEALVRACPVSPGMLAEVAPTGLAVLMSQDAPNVRSVAGVALVWRDALEACNGQLESARELLERQ